jgi:hypothetical protein
MERNYEAGKQYFWKDKSLGGYAKLIGELIIDDPTQEIVGIAFPPEAGDDNYFEVDLKDLYKYRDFIKTFTIGEKKGESTIFWIHLV